jgi:cbb3-type cytochrome oxidase subunit 1
VTSAADTMPQTAAPATDLADTRRLVRLHGLSALLFLFVGLVALLFAYGAVAWPDAVGSSLAEYLSYGHSLPIGLNALVYGWLTIGLTAVIYFFLPRLVATDLAFPRLAALNGLLMTAGVGVGIVAIAMGESAGGRMLEMPWYADAALAVSFLTLAVIVTATVRRSSGDGVGVPVWYFLAASWWLFLSFTAGAIPGLAGAPAELQSAFTATAVAGMWIASAAIGGGYALVATLVPDAVFHPRLGRIGFWSIGFLWVWTAARTLQYGPTPDWIETIPVLFSAGLLVAALVVVTDFAVALRGKVDAAAPVTSLRLFAVGLGLFLLIPGHMLLQSFRSTSSVVRFTAWEGAFDLLLLLGVFTFWMAALLGHVLAPTVRRRVAGTTSSRLMLVGVLFAVGTRWVAGLQQGYTWLAGVESGEYSNTGDGFFNTVGALHGTDILTFIGLAVFGAGALLLLVGLVLPGRETLEVDGSGRGPLAVLVVGLMSVVSGTALPTDWTGPFVYGGLVLLAIGFVIYRYNPKWRRGEVERTTVAALDYSWPDIEQPSTVRRGAAAVFALVVLTVFALPAIDSDREATALADESRNLEAGSIEALGRDVYVAEGCWYCHTQQVRAVVSDVGLGPVSTPGDFAYDPAGIFGVTRIGPDLAHAGSREPTNDAGWVELHLIDPRTERPWSTMPAYSHLNYADLTALAAYVAGLE